MCNRKAYSYVCALTGPDHDWVWLSMLNRLVQFGANGWMTFRNVTAMAWTVNENKSDVSQLNPWLLTSYRVIKSICNEPKNTSYKRTHPPTRAQGTPIVHHPQSMDCGRPYSAGRGQFPHRYRPRSVLPLAHSQNKCTGDIDLV